MACRFAHVSNPFQDICGTRMPRAPTELLAPDAELIFGLVGAVGTDLRRFQGILQNQLQSCGYSSIAIKMSDLIEAGLGASLPSPLNEAERIRSRMKGGTELRKKAGRGDALAMLAIAKIASERVYDEYKLVHQGIDPTKPGDAASLGESTKSKPLIVRKPRKRTAFILNSLKHPNEDELLREVYGPGYYLIGVNTSHDDRVTHLTKHLSIDKEAVQGLIETDEDEGDRFGQRMRDVYHRADVFISFRHEEHSNRDLERFLDLVFGNSRHER